MADCREYPGGYLAENTDQYALKGINDAIYSSKKYFWFGGTPTWIVVRKDSGNVWQKQKNGFCGAFSKKKLTEGNCGKKLPYICQRNNIRYDRQVELAIPR